MLLSNQTSNPKFDMTHLEGILTVCIEQFYFYKTEILITTQLALERALRLLLEEKSIERTIFKRTRGEALRLLRINSSRTFFEERSRNFKKTSKERNYPNDFLNKNK